MNPNHFEIDPQLRPTGNPEIRPETFPRPQGPSDATLGYLGGIAIRNS